MMRVGSRIERKRLGIHERYQTVDEIVDEHEASGLGAVSKHGQRFPAQRLQNEVADHPAIVRMHAWAVRVEDASDSYIDAVLIVVTVREGFSDPFAFVVARAWTDWVDVTIVRFGLWMDIGIAIDFRSAREQETRLCTLCETERVEGAEKVGLDGLDLVGLVRNRTCRAGEMVDLVHFDDERLDDVVTDELKIGMPDPLGEVVLLAGEKVVEDEHFVTHEHEAIHQMRADEAGASRNENPFLLGDGQHSGRKIAIG